MNIIIFTSLFTNLIMVGVSLITHFITYPSFRLINPNIFPEYHKSYTNKMLFIVAPIMTIELISTLLIVIFDINYSYTDIIILVVLMLIWVLTFYMIVPIHNKLSATYNKELNQKLIKYNGIRTTFWIIKLILFVGFCEDLTTNFH